MRKLALTAIALLALGVSLARAAAPANDEEFVGPLAGWVNVKTDCGAVGDGKADDTAALQKGLDEIRPADYKHPRVLYLPAGSYRITSTLTLARESGEYSMGITITGDDPATTIIKWDGPADGVMFDYGAWYSRIARLTLDGSRKAAIALRHGKLFVTANYINDVVFRDVGIGIEAGHTDAAGIAETPVVRCKFLHCSKAGVSIQNWNSLDWWLWWCYFDDCEIGVTNVFGAGHFHVYESVFRGSHAADIMIGNLSYFSIRNNYSVDSKMFLACSNFTAGALLTVQGNTIVHTHDAVPIYIGNLGPALLLDNTIVAGQGQTAGPLVLNAGWADGDFVSIGNTYTVPDPVKVRGRLLTFDDKVVAPESLDPPPPELPATPPHVQRKVFEIPAGARAADIQAAIDAAAKLLGQRPVIHLAPGIYDIDRTLVIPANCGLRLCGDSFIYFTQLRWTGATDGPMLLLRGPTRATLAEFHLNGQGKARGLVVEDCDQAGGRAFMDQPYLACAKHTNLLVNGVEKTSVRMHGFEHDSAATSVRVIGGAGERAGKPGEPVVIFSGAAGGNDLTYDVSGSGRLLVRDSWYETNSQPRFLRLTGAGDFTLQGGEVAVFGKEGEPAIELDDFHGNVALISAMLTSVNSKVPTGISVTGEGKLTNFLLFGIQPGEHDYFTNTSPQAHVARLACRQMIAGGETHPLDDVATPDPVFLRRMLAMAREARPTTLTPVRGGLTDLRIFRLRVDNALTGIELDAAAAPR